MAGRMDGKVAIVTGGNSGMGLATVEMFVEEGARVMIAARGEERGQAAADRFGENAAFIQTDVTSEDDIKDMIDATVDRWGRVDCLFSNAAAGCPAAKVEDFDTSDFQSRMMNILGSVFLGMKHVVPNNEKAGRWKHHQQRQHCGSQCGRLRLRHLQRRQSRSHPCDQTLGARAGGVQYSG